MAWFSLSCSVCLITYSYAFKVALTAILILKKRFFRSLRSKICFLAENFFGLIISTLCFYVSGVMTGARSCVDYSLFPATSQIASSGTFELHMTPRGLVHNVRALATKTKRFFAQCFVMRAAHTKLELLY